MSASTLTSVPALPGWGGFVSFPVASQSSDATYEVSVIVHDDGVVRISCACPARKRCKHIDQLEQVYVNLGQAQRTSYGSLHDVRPTLVSVATDDSDLWESY